MAVVDYINSSVTVMEGDSVDICVQLDIEPTAPLGRDVLVTLNLQDFNTTGNVPIHLSIGSQYLSRLLY